ncbi:YckD family protein [Clostridium sp. MSJ-4]|uniref:YckD family protein n=1 Tax=Clostridium simiarum TaxID=2841506 RepID=A0ABS6F4Z0_9CLOT|nr:DUF2680 domain-containing protein [Clostridium simiarum]MBU5592865.1 YckD family protein [Clostridium simiarum]
MKNKKIIAALVLSITMGIGARAYADTSLGVVNDNNKPIEKSYEGKVRNQCNKLGAGRLVGKKGYEFKLEALAKKLNMSIDELSKLRAEGKTFYQIAKEKGLSDEDYKSVMKEARMATIDKAIEEGKITKEQGDEIKAKIEENMKNCIPGEENSKKEKGGCPKINEGKKGNGTGKSQNKGE